MQTSVKSVATFFNANFMIILKKIETEFFLNELNSQIEFVSAIIRGSAESLTEIWTDSVVFTSLFWSNYENSINSVLITRPLSDLNQSNNSFYKICNFKSTKQNPLFASVKKMSIVKILKKDIDLFIIFCFIDWSHFLNDFNKKKVKLKHVENKINVNVFITSFTRLLIKIFLINICDYYDNVCLELYDLRGGFVCFEWNLWLKNNEIWVWNVNKKSSILKTCNKNIQFNEYSDSEQNLFELLLKHQHKKQHEWSVLLKFKNLRRIFVYKCCLICDEFLFSAGFCLYWNFVMIVV